MIVDSLAQTFNWSYRECISLSMKQILMLNHASWVNKARMDARLAQKKTTGEPLTIQESIADMPMWNGKRIDQLNSQEYLAYLKS